ncbi:MAG: hypothetical protein ACTHKZ_06035, partial [Lysobacteraceae bacterium]
MTSRWRSPAFWLPLLVLALLAGVLAFVPDAPAAIDPVSEWNAVAFRVGDSLHRGTSQAREMAMTHLAIHDALNAIRPRYATYAPAVRAPADASPQAAIAAAARPGLAAPVPGEA